MAVYRILHYPHVLLRKKSLPVECFTPELAAFASNMTNTMYAFEGIGLAAPQVGILKRLIVVDIKSYLESEELKDWHGTISYSVDGVETPLGFPLTLVNPTIAKAEGEVEFPFDGCLSFPGVSKGGTRRHKSIELHARTVDDKAIVISCDGIMSICLQHELDHLEGVLFIDHLKSGADEDEVIEEIHDSEDDPATRKKLKKLKLVDARNEKLAL
jgi:peptide deformylase